LTSEDNDNVGFFFTMKTEVMCALNFPIQFKKANTQFIMFSKLSLVLLISNLSLYGYGKADVLDDVVELPEAERSGYIAIKLEEYASQFSKSVISFNATERGTWENDAGNEGDSTKSTVVTGSMLHELVLSADNRYVKIQKIGGEVTLLTYNGQDGKSYRFDKNKKMTYADHFCRFPSMKSMTLDLFVNLTGITTFKSSSNAELISKVKMYSLGERRVDPKLGDCIVLKKETRGVGLTVERRMMYFGVRDSFLVLLRDETTHQSENGAPVNGMPALIRYKWLNDFQYGKKFGKLLPESWSYLITNEFCDLDGRLLEVSKELQRNPNIIRSTTTSISKVKFLDQFPTELFNITVAPNVPLVDSCQQVAQVEVAKEQKSGRWFNNWLLGLGLISFAVAGYFYIRSRRK